MITLEQVRKMQLDLFSEATQLVEKKGADYNREQQKHGDTLFNLRVAHLMNIVDSPQASVLARMCDKIMRLASLRNPSEQASNKEESVRDTVLDLINYASYYYAFWLEAANELQKDDS
jgi:hypothetical protein